LTGKGWENHIEGQKLKADGDSFRLKLNTQDIFEDWTKFVQQRNLGIVGRTFVVDVTRGGRSGPGSSQGAPKVVYKLRVNFHPEIITLSKEVKCSFSSAQALILITNLKIRMIKNASMRS
jgi:dynein heavy chain 1